MLCLLATDSSPSLVATLPYDSRSAIFGQTKAATTLDCEHFFSLPRDTTGLKHRFRLSSTVSYSCWPRLCPLLYSGHRMLHITGVGCGHRRVLQMGTILAFASPPHSPTIEPPSTVLSRCIRPRTLSCYFIRSGQYLLLTITYYSVNLWSCVGYCNLPSRACDTLHNGLSICISQRLAPLYS